jgi:hypothetical protein
MDRLAFAYPVKNRAALGTLREHFRSGSAMASVIHEHHMREGIRSVRVYLQLQPEEMMIVVVEGNNLKAHSRDRHGAIEIQKLNHLIEQVSGTNPEIHADEQPILIHEWVG